MVIVLFFFFSSRRRHTRLVSDWSSDVCSSDLDAAVHGAGLSYSAVGRATGLSPDQVARICHGEAKTVGVAQLSSLFSAVGYKLAARAYPGGDPIRDASQLALVRRLRDRIGA